MSRITRRLTRGATLVALAFSAVACEESSTTAGEPGRLSVLLTDQPGDFVHAVVTIDRIYLQPGEGEDAGSRVVLREDDVTTDLLTLANATAELVNDAVVPAGRYQQLRFVISGGYIEVENADGSTSIYASSPDYEGLPVGAEVDGQLHMPSLAQSGLKVKLPGDAVEIEGGDKVLLVDFDVSRSFGHQAGNSGRWVMTPVLEATEFAMTSRFTATVTKADTVTFPQINGTAVTLADFDAVLSTDAGSQEIVELTDANADGTYEAQFLYLAPGPYKLDLRAPSDSITFTTNPARPVAVTVGTTGSTQALVITSAKK